VGGILGHNLLSRAFFGGNPFVDGISRPQLVVSGLFFNDGIQAVTKPFSRTFFFFHNGILAITKPFSRTFFFFHDGILAFMKPFSRTFFFFHNGILAITKSFSRTFFFFHDGILAITIWGKTLFIYITKSIYIGSASLKTLPLDLEPLCKEKSTVLLILIQLGKEKLMFFPEITYRHVIQIF
jgi:hypothetical protein